MAIKNYNYNDNSRLSEHFKVSEFKCKCGKNHEIKIDSDLITLLENAMVKMGANICNIYSGYRCPTHDKNVGGNGTGPHTKGYAVDCYFLDKDRNVIYGDIVCCTLEDMGHKCGLAIRCGGSQVYQGKVHIDTKPRKWYGNEAISSSKSISSEKAISDGQTGHNDFLSYCFIPKVYYTTAKSGLNVRNIDNKIVDCLKYDTKINVYYIINGKAKIGINKYVSVDYIISESNKVLNEEIQENIQEPLPLTEEIIKEMETITDTTGSVIDIEPYYEEKEKNNSLLYLIQKLFELIKKLFKRP